MNARYLVLPLALAGALVAAALPRQAVATCTPDTVEVENRRFTLLSFTAEGGTATLEPAAAEAGWLTTFEQSANEAFGSPGALYANTLGTLTIETGPPDEVTP